MKQVAAFVCFLLTGVGICLAEECFAAALICVLAALVIAVATFRDEYKRGERQNDKTHQS